MEYQDIKTPRGSIHVTPDMKAELTWNPNFKQKWWKRYSNTQKYIDSEVIRLCKSYTPHLTGMLILSSVLGTDVGSGTVKWIAPYAKAQYYMVRKNVGNDPLRGPYWFERMKEVHGHAIISGARRVFASEK